MLLVVSSGDEQEAEGDAAVAADAEFPMITAAPGPGPGHAMGWTFREEHFERGAN